MAFCRECGNQLRDAAKFCVKCGTEVWKPPAPRPDPSTQPFQSDSQEARGTVLTPEGQLPQLSTPLQETETAPQHHHVPTPTPDPTPQPAAPPTVAPPVAPFLRTEMPGLMPTHPAGESENTPTEEPPETPTPATFCSNCGTLLSTTARFCGQCGNRVVGR